MSSRIEIERVIRELPHFAGIARDVADFLLMANGLMKKTIGWDHSSWQTVDPGTTLITNSTLVDIKFDQQVRWKIGELEFAGGDFNLLSDLIRDKQTAASLYLATRGNPSNSRRFREI